MDIASIAGKNIAGKFVVVRESSMKKDFKDLKYRLMKAEGGFGCSPDTMGRAVISTCVFDGETARWNRSDIERFATEKEIEQIKQLKKQT